MNTAISLKQFEDLALAVGNQTCLFMVGEAGIGKTATGANIFERGKEIFGFKHYVYVDGPNVELGEGGIYMPNHETETTTFYSNEAWHMHKCEPMLVFIDEFTKAMRSVQNMFHPLINERRFGPHKVHKNTVVILGGNLSSMGVGDAMAAHTLNRITKVEIRKPLAQEWCGWGFENGIDDLILAFITENPQLIESSYTDTTDEETLNIICNPKKPQQSFLSPRSAHKASNIFKERDKFSDDVLRSALEGTWGKPATAKFLSFVKVADSLPTWKEIIDEPKSARLPDSPAARCILAFSALSKVDRSNISKWFEYLKRAPKELQALFCLSAKDHKQAKDILFSSRAFVDWARENQYLF